ncbi:hypothetical protein PZE06_15545 [Robertmurraya sp. DFI.2.37]|uniref:hypothetical protein n=1 Tax=Robertmurraya sp. DFI.2.37 TaxID=3031819 RepID=UPI001248C8C5|nr:hypothetical protein [Robertmurraya sp. DFI.2.37]MDF1509556.1 hypothetical protein [Robertmurraya sp. DFI.2.37]
MTLVYFVMYIGMLILISLIDMFIWKQSFFQVIIRLFTLDEGTNEWFVSGTAFIGLICSIVIDYRLRKNKGQKQL